MKPYQATVAALIQAPAEQVYNVLADYQNGHPRILPKPYFISLEVEQGGFGAGTIINFAMRVMGQTQTFRAVISEPEPGRVLVETNVEPLGVVTTFTVCAVDGGRRSEVSISTDGRTIRNGLLGSLERFFTQTYLKRIYKKELKLLAAFAQRGTDVEQESAVPRAL